MRIRILTTLAVVSALVMGCEQPSQTAAPPQPTAASGPTYTFRLAPARNLVGCSRLDAALSREATVTVVGNEAHFRSAGGINDTGRQVRPGVYATDYSLANVRRRGGRPVTTDQDAYRHGKERGLPLVRRDTLSGRAAALPGRG
jgi:hypothetical protein